MSIFTLLFCFVWCITPSFGGCPTLYNVKCEAPTRNPWRDTRVFGTEAKQKDVLRDWAMMDDSIQGSCETTGLKFPKLTMIWLENLDVTPSYCSVTTICNGTTCMELGSTSQLFTEKRYLPLESMKVVKEHEETLFLNITALESHPRRDGDAPIRICNDTANVHQKTWDNPFNNYSTFLNTWQASAESYHHNYCKNLTIYDLHIQVKGTLSFFCTRLLVCNFEECYIFSRTAQKYAKIFPVNSCYSNSYPSLPICTAIEVNNWPLHQIRRHRPSTTQTGLFDLPFNKYCGPGTDISFQDHSSGPIGKTDEACGKHKLAYMLGEDHSTADADLLENVQDSPYHYAFWLAINTKQAFESVTGKKYTSSLYITRNNTAATFANHFYFNSVFDGFDANNTLINIIKEKEVTWKNVVLDIWRGQCYLQKPPGADTEAVSGTPLDTTPTGSQSLPLGTGSTEHSGNFEEEDLVLVSSDYPPPPTVMAPCRVVINEIQTNDGLNSKSFIELLRVCPKGIQRERAISLKNFYIAVLKAGDPLELHVIIDLGSQIMVPAEDTMLTLTDLPSKDIFYFVVGSLNMTEKNMDFSQTLGGKHGIPAGSSHDDTYSVVLLQSDSFNTFVSSCKSVLPIKLTEEDQESFGTALQDIVTYGHPCSRVICSLFMKWNLGLLQLFQDDEILAIPDGMDTKLSHSINRCSRNINPMQQESWKSATPTPLQTNKCSGTVDHVYTFKHGYSIQTSAQYVILNVKNFFSTYKKGTASGLLDGNALELTSKSTGVSDITIKKIESRRKEGTIPTSKGPKRKRMGGAIFNFAKADKQHLKKLIQDRYKSNLPPFFEVVYRDSQQYFKTKNPPRLMCNKTTFRKILYMMGFHFGRIKAQLVILERPDIIIKRGVYLKSLKENDKSQSPKSIIYTDVSWIDRQSRSGKAWIPKASHCDHKQKIEYTYARHHTNKGKKIILIQAAGPYGLIHNMEGVFEVGGSRKSVLADHVIVEDCHVNIESNLYLAWFRKLCINVQHHYGEAVIVIDNAPYHSKSDAPTSRSSKQDILNYLLNVDYHGKLTGFDKNQTYRRWQLLEFVTKYNKDNSDHYIIDQLAKEYGQTVIRLPPHQCDLNPMEMLWHQMKDHVRKNNHEQTIESVKKITKDFLNAFPAGDWRKLVRHTDSLREKYWQRDKLYDEFLDAHEDQIYDDPGTTDEEAVDSTGTTEYGPMDAYMHAGTEIVFDDNGDILSQVDGNNPENKHMKHGVRIMARKEKPYTTLKFRSKSLCLW